MTRQEADKIGEFLTFLVFFRAVPLFTWEVEKAEYFPDDFGLLVHVLNPTFAHEVLDLVVGISGVTFFKYHVQSLKDYALDIILY